MQPKHQHTLHRHRSRQRGGALGVPLPVRAEWATQLLLDEPREIDDDAGHVERILPIINVKFRVRDDCPSCSMPLVILTLGMKHLHILHSMLLMTDGSIFMIGHDTLR